MECCPVCRARLRSDAPACPRCGADLGLLLGIEAERERREFAAVACLAGEDLRGAAEAAGQALTLQRTPLALALAGFARHLAESYHRSGATAAESPEGRPEPMS
jgi:hypothetical protein